MKTGPVGPVLLLYIYLYYKNARSPVVTAIFAR